ncbi:MAG: NADH-quinone oxidoreductase subunit A, partial [Chloroflexi bacterium]|nr:NADH-quinone oxidoreductase subunit A [Chloroflexota bacterium]
MLNQWLFVGMFMILAITAGAAPIVVARFLAPHKPNKAKLDPYECGMETVGDTWVQFKVQYYIFALVFVVFDVETV